MSQMQMFSYLRMALASLSDWATRSCTLAEQRMALIVVCQHA